MPRIALCSVLALGACGFGEDPAPVPTAHGEIIWARNVTGSDALAVTHAHDTNGNLVMAMLLRGQADFRDPEDVEAGEEPIGNPDGLSLVLVKYAALGGYLWSTVFLGTFTEETQPHLAIDEDDDVFLLLAPVSEIDLGSGPLTGHVVAKLSGTDGDVLHAVSLSSAGHAVTPAALAVDGDGEVLLAGAAADGEPLGPEALWTAKLHGADLSLAWEATAADGVGVRGLSLVAGVTGDLLVVAALSDDEPRLGITPEAGRDNWAVMRLSDDDGSVIWTRHLAAMGSSAPPPRLAADPQDDLVVHGRFEDPADPEDDPGAVLPHLSTEKLSGASGETLWRTTLEGGDGTALPGVVAVDDDGQAATAAVFRGTLPFGDNTYNSGGDDFILFVEKQAPDDGAFAWVQFILASDGDDMTPGAITAAADGSTLVSGTVATPGESGEVVQEMFVLKLAP